MEVPGYLKTKKQSGLSVEDFGYLIQETAVRHIAIASSQKRKQVLSAFAWSAKLKNFWIDW
jgi:hypothetical protein